MVKCLKDAAHPYYCWVCDKKCPTCYNEKIGWRLWKSEKATNSDKLKAIRVGHEQGEGDYSLSFEMELHDFRIYDERNKELPPGSNSKDSFWEGPDGHFDVETGNPKHVMPEFVPNPWYSNSGSFEQWLSFVPMTLFRLVDLTHGGKEKVKLKHLYGDQGRGEDTAFRIGLNKFSRGDVQCGVQTNFSISLEVLGKYALEGRDPFVVYCKGIGSANDVAQKRRTFLCTELARWSRDRNITANPSKEALAAVGFWWCSLYFLCMECSCSSKGEIEGAMWKFRYDFIPRVSLYQLVCTGLENGARAVALSMFKPACDVFRALIERQYATFPRWDFIGVRSALKYIPQHLASRCKSDTYAFRPKEPLDPKADREHPYLGFYAAESASFVLNLLHEGLNGRLPLLPPDDEWGKVLVAITAPTRTKLFPCTAKEGFRVVVECRLEKFVAGKTAQEVMVQLTALKDLVEQMVKGPP